MSRLRGLVVFMVCTAAAAVVGARTEPGEWYASLARPAWTPPGWIFGPVWTTLYLMIAVAGYRVWRREGFGGAAVRLWFLQIVLNGLWSYLFFGRHLLGIAAIEIVVLWLSILACAVRFRRVDPVSSWLFVPYLLWVGFASALTIRIWTLNP